jgi:adenine-specific DNA-methyltransferase
MPHRLRDYGYGVSTGPLVWNRHKPQLRAKKGRGGYPVVWAESVSADGRFAWRAEKRNHAPWFGANLPRDNWLLVDRPCVLLQRTTAKEQVRRLIAAELPGSFIREHGSVVIENHLNMIRAIVPDPCVPLAAIAALLNSAVADAAFRCINGSVAVSAFELQGMPVPPPSVMQQVAQLLSEGATRSDVEALISGAYTDEAVADAAAAA